MKLLRRITATLALALAVTLGATGCAPASEPIAVSSDTVILDVRTPEEHASGHLEGSVNIDVQSPDFDALIAQLPTDGEYLVYCRSGNRSAAAVARLESLGFGSVIDAGGLDAAASATGLAITR